MNFKRLLSYYCVCTLYIADRVLCVLESPWWSCVAQLVNKFVIYQLWLWYSTSLLDKECWYWVFYYQWYRVLLFINVSTVTAPDYIYLNGGYDTSALCYVFVSITYSWPYLCLIYRCFSTCHIESSMRESSDPYPSCCRVCIF